MDMTRYRSDGSIRVAALAAVCVLGLALISACAGSRPTDAPDRSERNPLDALTRAFDAQDAVDFIGSPLPAGATEVHITGESALDTIVLVRFDAPMAEVTAWLAELGLTESLEAGYSPFFSSGPSLSEAAEWWEPAAADSTEIDYSGLYQQLGAKYYSVVVTPLGNGLVRVHLLVHNT